MVRFWFDKRGRKGANGDPAAVVEGLYGKRDDAARQTIYGLYDKIYAHIKIPSKYAIFMMGTAEDLQAALLEALLKEMEDISVLSGQLAAWYIRWADLNGLQTLVCIAGRGSGDAHYWDMPDGQTPAQLGAPASHWKELPKGRPPRWAGGTLRLPALLDALREVGKEPVWRGASEAPPALPAVPGPSWPTVEEMLTGLEQEKGQKKHLRCEPGTTTLYVHDDSLHSLSSREPKYAEAVKLIEAAIDQRFGPGTSRWAFRSIGIQNYEEGLRVNQIGEFRAAIERRRVIEPDLRLFRYDKIVAQKQQVTPGTYFTQFNHVSNFYVFFRNDHFETISKGGIPQGTKTQSRWDFTGNKVHVSVHSTAVGAAWNLLLPILLRDCAFIKEFKITDMARVQNSMRQRGVGGRIFDGAQISIYHHGAADGKRFVEMMESVTWILRNARITTGSQPESDLVVNEYLSFRREIDDLIDQERYERRKQESLFNAWLDEGVVRESVYMDPEASDYPLHKKLMKKQPLYKMLCSERTIGRKP